jgi:hypothetical protein
MSLLMCIKARREASEVTAYGSGSLGGKGEGLARLNDLPLARVIKLKSHILTTSFFDSYRESNGVLGNDFRTVLAAILEDLGDMPLGIRSSATNEGSPTAPGQISIHAGENASFMVPNNHPQAETRLSQALQAIGFIYEDFRKKQPPDSREKMAVVINPIPGIFDDTMAGPVYYPYISGVANSFFPHALKNQNPEDGFARIAFGHGYATVLDDFPVISMATIRNPIPIQLMRIGNGQKYFYALDMTQNSELRGQELETMRKLHVRFANFHKIRLLGLKNNLITIEELVQNNHFDFKTGLLEIMETIGSRMGSHFQIEFVFNLDFARQDRREGAFHLVQLTRLPELKFEKIQVPSRAAHTYLDIGNAQGHGIARGIKFAVVVSPFRYAKEHQAAVRRKIAKVNEEMRGREERYIMVVPGRLGSQNAEWGINVDFNDVDRAAAIFEYGVDIAGRPEPLPEDESSTGGVYGSHFLYMLQGGFDEDQKRLQTRMYGTQGTHFLTNLISNNIIYGYIAPLQDSFDPWLFSSEAMLSVLTFPQPVAVYADSLSQTCRVLSEND